MPEDGHGLLGGILARGPVAAAVSDHALLAAMLEAEVALAHAEGVAGVIPADHAEAIAAAARTVKLDPDALGIEAARSGTPVLPLLAALRAELPRSVAASLHHGATSQDIVDTASMLVASRANEALLVDLGRAADAAAGLADEHRSTIMAGRTLLQHALPTTFGAKAATWLVGLDTAIERLAWVRGERLAVQLGGAAGTLAALGTAGPAIVRDLARALRLCEPPAPWHVERTRVADLAGALGLAAAAVAKPALDLVLLAQSEIDEVRDAAPERGASSSMPQKRNPIAAVAARACAAQAPGLVATILAAAGASEHERGAGAWHAEWRPLAELFSSVGSAAAWLADALDHAVVDPQRMRANLDLGGGTLLAERIVGALTPELGGERATAEVQAAVQVARDGKRSFGDALIERQAIREHLDQRAITELLDPRGYLGSVETFIDNALAAHERRARA